MKIEIGEERPSSFTEYWPGQFDLFHHFEFAAGIPHTLFAVTTFKENGKPNVCFGGWGCFQGDGGGYFALFNLCLHTHACADIVRDGDFCLNFLAAEYYDAMEKTIRENDYEADEFETGGFTREAAAAVKAPRIRESFLSLECRRTQIQDLSGAGKTVLVIGRVLHVALEEEYAKGIDQKYSRRGFMLNIHSPYILNTGEASSCAVGSVKVEREID